MRHLCCGFLLESPADNKPFGALSETLMGSWVSWLVCVSCYRSGGALKSCGRRGRSRIERGCCYSTGMGSVTQPRSCPQSGMLSPLCRATGRHAVSISGPAISFGSGKESKQHSLISFYSAGHANNTLPRGFQTNNMRIKTAKTANPELMGPVSIKEQSDPPCKHLCSELFF